MTNNFGNLYVQEELKQNTTITELTQRIESLEFSNLSLTVQNLNHTSEISALTQENTAIKHRLQLLELWVSRMN